ncbi:MAG: hypothetical protein M3P87_02515 [Actinomycetota bacterium]|nr:hypothetical protein [Actinomycetota bacterium]
MIVGVLVTGDTAVRAAHSLSAHPTVDEVVVIGPARSKSFQVVPTAEGCDLLVGTGPDAPGLARNHGVRLIWDGETTEEGVIVAGGSAAGLALAMAAREPDPRLVAVAHPDFEEGSDHVVRFPEPVGRGTVADTTYSQRRVAMAKSPNRFAACLAVGAGRSVTIVDDGAFLSGIALAAGVDIAGDTPKMVFDDALTYLQTATDMGLVLADNM